MRTFWKWALVLAVPAVWVATARPAEEIAPDTVTSELLMLRQKSVQEELKLSPEVVKKIAEFTSKESDEAQKLAKLGEKERDAKFEELEAANKKFLEDNLTAAQRKRLGQITLQVTGLLQLSRPEVIKVLGLTEEQQKKVKEMQADGRKALDEIIADKTRAGKNEKFAKLRAEIDKKIEALLTAEQKTKARELVGEPFKGEIVFEEPE
jgi:hypothetical protein